MAETAEMPRYKCHKVVRALKIAIVAPLYVGGATITPYEKGFAPFEVSQEYLDKHKPQADGYYVVYEDGYESYSPAQAFETGYTLVVEASGSSRAEGGSLEPSTKTDL